MSTVPLLFDAKSHIGLVHGTNEDSYAVIPTEDGGLLLGICDGMGGMGRGDEASALALSIAGRRLSQGKGFPPDRMRLALEEADLLVRRELCQSPDSYPGSTAVLVYVLDGLAHIAWVGDSRAYLFRDGSMISRTTDHKYVEDLVAAGEMTADEARTSEFAHLVTRAIGGRGISEGVVAVAIMPTPWVLQNGDVIVLCSDGVSDLILDEELADIVDGSAPDDIVQRVIDEVLARGAHDNTTLIVGRWDGDDTDEELADLTPVIALPRTADGRNEEMSVLPTERPLPAREARPVPVLASNLPAIGAPAQSEPSRSNKVLVALALSGAFGICAWVLLQTFL